MDSALRDFIDNLMKTFDQYHVTDPHLLHEIEGVRRKYVELAEKTGDLMSFCTALPESGCSEEFTRVATKIVMQQNAEAAAAQAGSEESGPVIPTVREFLEQYRPAYEEVCKHPERPRGRAAYERLFHVADETEDMLEAQILMERNHLAWDLTYFDALDSFESRLRDMDPLFLSTTATLLHSIEAVKASHSPEEYAYQAARHEVLALSDAERYQAEMLTVLHLALRLVEFSSLKRDFYRSHLDHIRKGIVGGLLAKREEIRKVLAFMESAFGLTFEALLENEGLKIWLLNPFTADDGIGLGRKKSVMHPQNYEVFRDIIENDIRPDLPIAAILARRPEKVLWYKL